MRSHVVIAALIMGLFLTGAAGGQPADTIPSAVSLSETASLPTVAAVTASFSGSGVLITDTGIATGPDTAGSAGEQPNLIIEFFPVGLGDASLLTTPGGRHYLIDAGPDPEQVLHLLQQRGITHLDGMVASHPHADHIGGMPAILRTLEVGTIYDAGYPYTTSTYRDFLTAALASDARYVNPVAGDTLDWDPALAVLVLHPDTPTYSKLNNNSLVLRVQYGACSIMFTGDVEAYGERRIIDNFSSRELPPRTYLTADILKVAHHGSKNSSTGEFLDLVNPQAAVISAPGSEFHPHPLTLQRLQERHSTIFRTDTDGIITVIIDPYSWTISGAASGRFQGCVKENGGRRGGTASPELLQHLLAPTADTDPAAAAPFPTAAH